MQQKNKFGFSLLAISVMTLTLSACGGGGSDTAAGAGAGAGAPTTRAEGVYSGTYTGGLSGDFLALVLENDDIWVLYESATGLGIVQGQGTSTNTGFTSSNAKDFGVFPAVTGTVAATYVANTSFSGTITSGATTLSFNGVRDVPSSYDYNAVANLTLITGAWSLTATDGSAVALTIATNGTLAGNSAGCSFTGTVGPRASGKNVFDVSVTFGGAPCALPGQVSTGIGLTSLNADGTRELIVAGVDSARTVGDAFFGSR